MELKKYTLHDVCTIIPGYAFKSTDFGYGNNVAIKIKDINPPIIDIKKADKVGITPAEKYKLSKGDFVMAMTGATIGKVGMLQTDLDHVYINQRVCKFVSHDDVCDKEYLYYLLSTSTFRKFILNNLDNRFAQPNIGHPTVYNFGHLFPLIEGQRQIASVLHNIDRKIELNKRINDNLEAMAKQLYNYWFLQFDFLNEEGKPFKSSGGAMVWNDVVKQFIPQSWKVHKVKDLLPIITGKRDANFATKHGKYKFFTCSQDVSNCDVAEFEGSAVLIAGNGDFNVKHYTGSFNAYQRTYVLVPPTKFYAVIFMTSSILLELIKLKRNSNGSVIKFITKADVENIAIFDCGDEDLYNRLNNLLFMIEQNNNEIELLTKLRDKLLPLLMSGQVSVN